MTGVLGVVMSRSFQLSAAALALGLLLAACSSAGSPTGAEPATSLAAATRLAEPEAAGAALPRDAPAAYGGAPGSGAPEHAQAASTGISGDAASAEAHARRRSSSVAPLSALTQIVTAQALLVSLLLAPLPSAAEAERVEPTARTEP